MNPAFWDQSWVSVRMALRLLVYPPYPERRVALMGHVGTSWLDLFATVKKLLSANLFIAVLTRYSVVF